MTGASRPRTLRCHNDDGARTGDYAAADVILVGVSRTGKTPTCLYLALAYGVFAANYPLSEDDLESGNLPKVIEPFRRKLYGLTISPERLQQIRKERRPVGRYSSAEQVRFELRGAEGLCSAVTRFRSSTLRRSRSRRLRARS